MDAALLPDAFYLDLDDAPSDTTTLCALADWHEERGEIRTAECVRWTIRHDLRPILFSRDGHWRELLTGPSWHDGWYWWVVDESNWVEERSCRLAAPLWNRLDHSFPYVPSIFKEYPTRRVAYEALFEAWPLFAPRDRVTRQREGAR